MQTELKKLFHSSGVSGLQVYDPKPITWKSGCPYSAGTRVERAGRPARWLGI